MLDSSFQWTSRFSLTINIIFLLTYGFNTTQGCSDIFSNHFGTTTSDMAIKEGDPMEIKCSLLTSSIDLGNGTEVNINSDMLLFKYNGTRIQNSKIQRIDNFTIQYKVKRTSMKENGYYMCYIDVGLTDVKPRAVCATYITIGYAPSASDDFNLRCTGYDLKNLTCRWDLQHYNVITDYNLSLIVHDEYNYSMCPNRIGKHTCIFTTRDPSPYLISDKKLKFRLDVQNKFGSLSKIFQIDHYSNVLLGPIASVNFVTIGSQNVYLTWKPPNSIADDPYLEDITEYLLKVYPVQSDEISNQTNYITEKSDLLVGSKFVKMVAVKGSRQFNLSDLIPFTRYRFEVRCRLVTDSGEGQWSNEFVDSFQTRPDVPYYYPVLHPGGYEIVHKSDKTLDIVVYYDKVDKAYANGPNFTLVLYTSPISISTTIEAPVLTANLKSSQPSFKFQSDQDKPSASLSSSSQLAKSFNSISTDPFTLSSPLVSESNSESPSSPRPFIYIAQPNKHYGRNLTNLQLSSFLIENIPTTIDLKVTMFAFNDIGFAAHRSNMEIPVASRSKVHPGVDQFYAINWYGNNYTLYWKHSSREIINNFTIFWCKVTDTPQCDQNIHHIDVPASQSSIKLTVDYPKVQFGISVIESPHGLSNGIKWATCIESGSYIPIKNRFRRFNLLSVGSKYVSVDWQIDCPALDHFIDHYEIHYCRIDHPCSQTLILIDVDKLTTQFNVSNLDSSTGYNFTIRAVTVRGEKLDSPTVTIETKVDIFTLIVGISVVIGGIILILTVLYTLLICTMRKRNDEKKLKQSVDSNWIPKMPSRLKGDANILLNPLSQETRNEYENKEYMISDSNTNINKFNSTGFNSKLHQQLIRDDKNNVIILSTISGNDQLNDLIPCSSSSSSVSPSTSSSITEEHDEGLELTSSTINNHVDCNRRKLIKSFSSVSSISSLRRNRSRKYSDGGGCDSEDSGYSTKLSDKNVYYKGDTFTINGLIKSIDENSPYIVVPDKKSSTIGNIINSSTLSVDNVVNNLTINRHISDPNLSCNNQTTINDNYHPSSPNDYLPSQNDYHQYLHNQNEPDDLNTISNGYVYA